MVRIKPIGKQLLIHSITVIPHQRDANPVNQWEKKDPPKHGAYIIAHVRLQPVNQNLAIKGVQGVSITTLQGINYRLFIDYANSLWQTDDHRVPAVQDAVIFQNERREVKQVSAVYAMDDHPHHWEVLLT
ncbi:putative minor capsid protein [Schleiferilactobacillus harbinensis]|uniref:putative minor capsid protein n=1 Tax=Schleiferilactobacillus harbinensis TaxID=304207 RepID=UPI00186AFE75|nr:putative minor capsid protein [Schleiferilactobacillus harbinensis]